MENGGNKVNRWSKARWVMWRFCLPSLIFSFGILLFSIIMRERWLTDVGILCIGLSLPLVFLGKNPRKAEDEELMKKPVRKNGPGYGHWVSENGADGTGHRAAELSVKKPIGSRQSEGKRDDVSTSFEKKTRATATSNTKQSRGYSYISGGGRKYQSGTSLSDLICLCGNTVDFEDDGRSDGTGGYYFDPKDGRALSLMGSGRLIEIDYPHAAECVKRCRRETYRVLEKMDKNNFREHVDELKAAIRADIRSTERRKDELVNNLKDCFFTKDAGTSADVSGMIPLFRDLNFKRDGYYYTTGFFYDPAEGRPYEYFSKIGEKNPEDKKILLSGTTVSSAVEAGEHFYSHICDVFGSTDADELRRDPEKLRKAAADDEFFLTRHQKMPDTENLIYIYGITREGEQDHVSSSSYYIDPKDGEAYRYSSSYDIWAPMSHFSSGSATTYAGLRPDAEKECPDVYRVLVKMNRINYREHLDELKEEIRKYRSAEKKQ